MTPALRRPRVLIGVDSDGCVFGSPEVKQRRHLQPLILKQWGLQPLEKEVRALSDYVNLRSPMRGANRFAALLRVFELLEQTGAAKRADLKLPDLEPLRAWMNSDVVPSNDTLLAASKSEPALIPYLQWSLAVNRDIAARMKPIEPFAWVKPALRKMKKSGDVVVVSLTPRATVAREWKQQGIDKHVKRIMGLEAGPKSQQLKKAMAAAKTDPEHTVMIGDAPGDLRAARKTGAAFFPIIPGKESACWKVWLEEDLNRFLKGTYRGVRMELRIRQFQRALSAPPPEGL